MKPMIGLTLDAEAPGGYSKYPWYALRQNYCDAVSDAGGIPVLLPHHGDHVGIYLEHIDGIIVTGGDFDIDPTLYGEEKHPSVTTKPNRTQFEWELLKQAYAKEKAILGICGGMQLLNVVLGGSLIQHIPDAIENALAHEQPNPRSESGHNVRVEANTRLFEIVRAQELSVNSAHHQAVKAPPATLRVSAYAPDGVIEAIEDSTHRFCIGVQWHPEFHVSPTDQRIFQAFIDAAQI